MERYTHITTLSSVCVGSHSKLLVLAPGAADWAPGIAARALLLKSMA